MTGMKVVTLVRKHMRNCTPGYIITPAGTHIATLELPWRKNERNKSAIPAGEYRVRFLPRSASGKYNRVWHIQGVPGRTGILIHKGNYTRDTHGCILIGLKHTWAGNAYSVTSSRVAINKMRAELGTKDFILKIITI